MSGRVPPSSRANVSRSARSQAQKAALLFERFTGHDTTKPQVINVDPLPSAVAVIGECDGILYTTVRDGRKERYIHEFKAKDKPLLCISPDGRQILLIGGAYIFTERGIVDASDTKNLPPEFRRKLRRGEV
jgi:hypothetical protein